MKRDYIYSLLVFVAAILCSVGCSKIEEKLEFDPEKGNNVLEGTFEGSGKTKTTLSGLENGVYKALWSSGDQIAVFIDGNSDGANYKLISGEDSPVASFRGYGKGESYVALYPAEMARELQGSELMIELPAEQVYQANSFGVDSYPMLAVSNSNSLEFKNTCAILGVSMTGNHNIKSIEFRTNNEDVCVSGAAKIDVSQVSEPVVVMESGASNVVTLQCNGVSLHQQNVKDFYIVLPAQIYKGGFTLTIYTSTGKMVKTVSEDVELKRSRIRKLKTFECKLDEGIEPSKTLAGEGTESSPFLVKSLEDLLLMQGAVNSVDGVIIPENSSAGVDAKTAHYKLISDLSLSAVCGESGENWIPIGNYSENEDFVFRGVFDGDGHTISDLYISSDCAYQGLFGMYEGIIKNLTVDGYVKGCHACGIICGGEVYDSVIDNICIDNCSSYGNVEGIESKNGNYFPTFGGIVGDGGYIFNCINYANVTAYYSAGGITGSTSYVLRNCINRGTIVGYGSYSGGIVGYQNSGNLFNCYNEGTVTGVSYVGGISGYSRQGAKLFNCYNCAEVSGEEIIGGIVGECDTYSHNPLATKVKNCINSGPVVSKSNGNIMFGAICGHNVSEVTNCYWLYDPQNSLGSETGVGLTYETGKTENCYSLNVDQIKGITDAPDVLYTAADGESYYKNILDALNGWAFDNTTDYMMLYGWMQGTENGYPQFTGKMAEKPSGIVVPIFELYENEFEVSGRGGEITVELKATMNYYISSMPSWIKEVTPEGSNDTGVMKKHIFKIEENPEYVDRQGVIVFCNESQQCIPVTVNQKAKTDEDLSWLDKEFWHKSLFMRFTADWCGYCPMMATAIADAQEQKPNKIEALSLHGSGGLYASASSIIESHYGINSYPTGIVDGIVSIPNYTNISHTTMEIIDAAQKTEQNNETLTGASWSSSISGNSVSLSLTAYLKRAGSYKLTALLVEDNIRAYQNGEGNNYLHRDVVRAAFTNALGDAIPISEDGQAIDLNYTVDIPSGCNRDNLKIVVYIQRPDSRGTYFVDNATSASVGKEMPLMVISDGIEGGIEGITPGEDIPYNN